MSKTRAKKIAEAYIQNLEREKIPFHKAFLFGSWAKNKGDESSDIDIAVISKKNTDKDRLNLWTLREGIDNRIEPHNFTPKEFSDINDPFVYEIKKTGIEITV